MSHKEKVRLSKTTFNYSFVQQAPVKYNKCLQLSEHNVLHGAYTPEGAGSG